MAKKNYNKISTTSASAEQSVEPKDQNVEPQIRPAVIEEPEPPTIGVVTDCGRLNIREKPNIKSSIVCEVPIASELTIDLAKSNNEWFKVRTKTGKEGFCMKKYVAV